MLERYRIYSREELLTREEFLEAIKQMNQRFEMVDKRFEMMDKRFESLIEEMHYGFDKTHVILTSFGARAGVRLEKTMVNLAKKALEQRHIDLSKIEYNKDIIDDGTYFEKGYKTHIDLYVHNSTHFFFDIKFQYNLHDLYDFLKRVKLAENYLHIKSSKNIVIGLEIAEDARKEAEKRSLDIITID